MLTPEEFLASGDYLVRTCPTWSWCGAACAAHCLLDGPGLCGLCCSVCTYLSALLLVAVASVQLGSEAASPFVQRPQPT